MSNKLLPPRRAVVLERAEARNVSRLEYGEVITTLVRIFILVFDVLHHDLVGNRTRVGGKGTDSRNNAHYKACSHCLSSMTG